MIEQNSVENKNLITFLGAKKNKEQREALETPNKLCKTFRDTMETLSNSDFNLSIRENQILIF
jgi:hypothetical protein